MKKYSKKIVTDLVILGIIFIGAFILSSCFDVFEQLVEISAEHEEYELDEIISASFIFMFCLIWFSVRRWREASTLSKINSKRNEELEIALHEIKDLKKILPLCSFCK